MNKRHREHILKIDNELAKSIDWKIIAPDLILNRILPTEFLDWFQRKYSSVSSSEAQTVHFFQNYVNCTAENAYSGLVSVLRGKGFVSEAELLESVDMEGQMNDLVDEVTAKLSMHLGAVGINGKSKVEPLPSNGTIATYPELGVEDSRPFLKVKVQSSKVYNCGYSDEDTAYKMMSKPRGYALIINNIKFENAPEDFREGAQVDTQYMTELLTQLGFEITHHYNVNKQDFPGIRRTFLDKFGTEENPAPVDACVIVMMSHGWKLDDRYLQMSNNESVDPYVNKIHIYEDVVYQCNNLLCPALYKKPKLFIFQMCRGENRDRGVLRATVQHDSKGSRESPSESASSSSVSSATSTPKATKRKQVAFEDIFIMHSTVPGFVSGRDTLYGSWFIECLCEVFMVKAHDTELYQLAKEVGKHMKKFSSETETTSLLQMCSAEIVGFHKHFFFNPGLYACNDETQ